MSLLSPFESIQYTLTSNFQKASILTFLKKYFWCLSPRENIINIVNQWIGKLWKALVNIIYGKIVHVKIYNLLPSQFMLFIGLSSLQKCFLETVMKWSIGTIFSPNYHLNWNISFRLIWERRKMPWDVFTRFFHLMPGYS